MVTRNYFLRRASKLKGLPKSLRDQILEKDLYTELGEFFQVADCERVLSIANTPHPAQSSVYESSADAQFLVTKPDAFPIPQYPPYPYPRKAKQKKAEADNSTTTILLIVALLIASFFGYMSLTGTSFQDLISNFSGLGSGKPGTISGSCGGDMPNTYLQFGMWRGSDGVDYFVPTNTPSLHEETSALCFDVAEMHRFYSQTSIAINSKTVSGQEALVRAILSATIKSGGIAETDPMFRNLYDMVMTAVGADKFLTFTDPSDAQYMYVLLPSLGELKNSQSTPLPEATTTGMPIIPTSTLMPTATAITISSPTSMPMPTVQAVIEENNAILPDLMTAYGVPTITPGAPTLPPVSFVSLDWLISSGKAVYGACSPIPYAGGSYDYSERWPMDGAVRIYLTGLCGEGQGENYQVDFRPYADRHVSDPNYRSIHISQNPYPNWGPAYQIPGTGYFIQPFNP